MGARAMFEEAKHPRGFHGKFGSGGATQKTKLVGASRIASRLAMAESGIRYDYTSGRKKPRHYMSPKAIEQHGAGARIPVEEAIAEDLQLRHMDASQKLANAAFRAKRNRNRARTMMVRGKG